MVVTITNNTKEVIRVRVTKIGEADYTLGGFYPIEPERADTWDRVHTQVAFVKRNDNGQTETYVVEANQGLAIG